MLVLSRHKDEGVVIHGGRSGQVRVVVVDIRGDKVRLGFEADRSIPIHREEVQALIDAAEGEAAP